MVVVTCSGASSVSLCPLPIGCILSVLGKVLLAGKRSSFFSFMIIFMFLK